MKNIAIIGAFLLLIIGIVYSLTVQYNNQPNVVDEAQKSATQITQSSPDSTMKQPKSSIDKSKKYSALMKTAAGDMEIELYADKTPITVNNFVTLSKKDFYKNVIFHRTIKGFMIQSGDPTGTGSGGPGYQIKDEPFEGEYTKGIIAMANTGQPNSGGSQFFIMHADVKLPKTYTIFGKVVKGLDVIDKIAEAPTKPEGEGSSPINPVKILSVTITEK